MENRKITLGEIRSIPKTAVEDRRIPFVLSTYTKDRHGTVLNQDGWELDNYRQNPVVAYQHNLTGNLCQAPDPDFIIGKSVKIGCEGYGQDRKLVAEAEFEPPEINALAEKIFRKCIYGSLSRTSVGFVETVRGHFGSGDEMAGFPNETYYFGGQELLEWSVVNIPSNPDAGKRGTAIGKLRSDVAAGLMYAYKELGGKFSLSQLENMTVPQIMDLLDARDLEIRTTDPEKVRKMLTEQRAMPKTEEPKKHFVQFPESETNKSNITIKSMKNENLFWQAIMNASQDRKQSAEVLQIMAEGNEDLKNVSPTFQLDHPKEKIFAWPLTRLATADYLATHTAFPADARGPRSLMDQLGVTRFTSKANKLRVPVSAKFTQAFKADGTDADDGAPTGDLSYIDFSANSIIGQIDISRQFDLQGGPDLQNYVINQMNIARESLIAKQTFGVEARSATAWQGAFYKTTTGADTKASAVIPGKANILDLQKQVADAEAFHGNLAYLTSPKGARILMQTPREAGLDRYILEDGKMFGFPVYVDENVSDVAGQDGDGSGLIFGDFSSLGVVQFGALLVCVDPYTQARVGKLRLTFHSWFDVRGLQGSYKTDEPAATTDPDEYAHSFASICIKSAS